MLLQAIVACVFIIHVEAQFCYQDWQYHEGSCYGFGEDPASWEEAQVMCSLFDSKLAEIETSAENDYLKSMAKTKGGDSYWIGATDVFHEGVWVWVSSRESIVSFTDWSSASPNDVGGGQDCLSMEKGLGFQWNDRRCQELFDFICEASPLEQPVIG